MKPNKALQVLFDNRVVGTLALAANHKVVFQYDDSWLEQGFSISPFSLPLENQVFVQYGFRRISFSMSEDFAHRIFG